METAQGAQHLPAIPEHTPGRRLERAGGGGGASRVLPTFWKKRPGQKPEAFRVPQAKFFFHIFFLVVQKTPSIKLSILSILSVQVSSVPILILLLHDRSLVLFHLATLKLNVANDFPPHPSSLWQPASSIQLLCQKHSCYWPGKIGLGFEVPGCPGRVCTCASQPRQLHPALLRDSIASGLGA